MMIVVVCFSTLQLVVLTVTVTATTTNTRTLSTELVLELKNRKPIGGRELNPREIERERKLAHNSNAKWDLWSNLLLKS